jgi:hypothetical protein
MSVHVILGIRTAAGLWAGARIPTVACGIVGTFLTDMKTSLTAADCRNSARTVGPTLIAKAGNRRSAPVDRSLSGSWGGGVALRLMADGS